MFWKIRSNLEKNLEFDLYNSNLWKWIRNSSTILIFLYPNSNKQNIY